MTTLKLLNWANLFKSSKIIEIGLEDNEFQAMFKSFDIDGTRSVDYEEFLGLLLEKWITIEKPWFKKF